MPIRDINSLFDDISSVNDAKKFDQSQPPEQTVFDSPDFYQEFSNIEHEVDVNANMLVNLESYNLHLKSRAAVNKQDRQQLLNIVSSLESVLPEERTYTEIYSRVNYNVTQESVFTAIGNAAKATYAAIIKYINTVINFLKRMFTNLFSSSKDIAKKTDQADKSIEKVKEAETETKKKVKDSVVLIPPMPPEGVEHTPEQKRALAVHTKLKAKLSRYNNLSSLSVKHPIDVKVLFAEMYEQKVASFYTVLLDKLYNKDPAVQKFINGLMTEMVVKGELLQERTEYLMGLKEHDVPQGNFQTLFDDIDNGIKAYVNKPDSFKDVVITLQDAYDIVNFQSSIVNTVKLDIPNEGILFDTKWMETTFGEKYTSRDIEAVKLQYEKFKELRPSNNKTPEFKEAFDTLYKDWRSMNRIVQTLLLINVRCVAVINHVMTINEERVDVYKILAQ